MEHLRKRNIERRIHSKSAWEKETHLEETTEVAAATSSCLYLQKANGIG